MSRIEASCTRLISCAVGHTNESSNDGDTGASIAVLIRTRVGGAAQRVSISAQTFSDPETCSMV